MTTEELNTIVQAVIDKINKQLDELNVMHATQIFRLKQALMTMATEK